MTRHWKLILGMILICMVIAACSTLPQLNRKARIGIGYKVKVTCSEVFVAGRDFDEVLATNFFSIDPLMDRAWINLDREKGVVTGSLFWLGRSKAIYREGAGCTVVGRNGVSNVSIPVVSAEKLSSGHKYETDLDENVQIAVEALFDDDALDHPIVTRAVVVIQDGQIIAEHYADGFTKNTRQQSWSMAKGFMQALIGILIDEGVMSLDDKALLPDWQAPDPRAEITLGHLLHMASGLEFSEDYADTNSDVDQMLFNRHDMGLFAASKQLAHEPGTTSIYSSGTTNIVSRIMRNRMAAAGMNYHAFPRSALFDKIGMTSAIFEVDASGSFIGSSYIYATPRDYARFGQLYLQDGVWEGERILPEGWVDYTREAAPHSDGKYGSHWSVNASGGTAPGMPADVIDLGGNDGQYIFVIPSKNAVIVRMGVMREPASYETDLYPLIRTVYDALK